MGLPQKQRGLSWIQAAHWTLQGLDGGKPPLSEGGHEADPLGMTGGPRRSVQVMLGTCLQEPLSWWLGTSPCNPECQLRAAPAGAVLQGPPLGMTVWSWKKVLILRGAQQKPVKTKHRGQHPRRSVTARGSLGLGTKLRELSEM